MQYHNIHVVYTKEAETADQYIEKVTNQLGKKFNVTVATSDRLEQMIVWGQGAKRLSANGLREEIDHINKEIKEKSQNLDKHSKNNSLSDHLSEEILKAIKDIE